MKRKEKDQKLSLEESTHQGQKNGAENFQKQKENLKCWCCNGEIEGEPYWEYTEGPFCDAYCAFELKRQDSEL